METRAHHVLIGLFSVLLCGAALLFALWLNQSGREHAYNEYLVIFNEAVSGLSEGSAVQYNGIKIGDVASLDLDPEDPRKVLARIRVVGATPIREDTRARLSITGITGAAVIQLHAGTPGSPRLKGPKGELPVIAADTSPLAKLLNNGDDLMGSVTRLLDQANLIFSAENAGRVSRTLAHLEQISASVAAQRDDLGQTLTQLKQAAQQTSELMRNADRLLNGPARQTLEQSAQLMSSLARNSRQVEQLLKDNQAAIDSGLHSLGELGPALAELRATLNSLHSFSRQLKQDPSGTLLRRERIEEFQP